MIDRLYALFNQLIVHGGDFNRGYAVGVAAALAILLALLLLRIVLALLFRKRRCTSITVPFSDGDVVISQGAAVDAIRSTARQFPHLSITDVVIYRVYKAYQLVIYCDFDVSGGTFAAQTPAVKQKIQQALHDLFGIANLKKIRIHLNELRGQNVPRTGGTVIPTDPSDPLK